MLDTLRIVSIPVEFDGTAIVSTSVMTVNSKSSSSALSKLAIPGVVFLLGILLTVWMQVFVSGGVFLGSDAGLKALLSQQIAGQLKAGSLPLDMSLTPLTADAGVADWVTQLWSQGLAPITPPFAYPIGAQQFITFSFIFPLITAPFYALFGEPGFYVVPILALWATWGRFWQIGLRSEWDTASLSLGLFALIFASPLSLYGSTYWEQTLAVAFAFWGVTALLYPKKTVLAPNYLPGTRLIVSGVLIGLSIWLRPEFLGLLIAAVVLAVIGWLLPKWRLIRPLSMVDTFVFIGSLLCTVCVFLAINFGIYGHPLGLHGLHLVDERVVIAPLQQAKSGYGQLLLSTWRYFPVATLAALAALCSPEFKRASLKTANRFKGFKTPNVEEIGIISPANNEPMPARAILVLCFFVALITPFVMPVGMAGKQWGPRLYLILVPLLSVVVAEQLRLGFFQNWARRIMLMGTAIALAFGIHMNTLNGAFNVYEDAQTQSTSLLANHVSVAPAIAQLKAQPATWVATNNPFVVQQFWGALPSKTFFRTDSLDAVKQLASVLAEQNEQTFLYVCGPYQTCDASSDEITFVNGNPLVFDFIGQFGRYPLYKVEIAS
ncbi:MAG: hypothetical protein AB8B99_15040 [Phormidesmis sp.]